jgi:hypothetical protein
MVSAGEAIGEGLATVGTTGAAAYVLKNAKLPPAAKVGLVTLASGASALFQAGSKKVSGINIPPSNKSSSHPNSPTDGPTGEFTPSSPLEYSDITS